MSRRILKEEVFPKTEPRVIEMAKNKISSDIVPDHIFLGWIEKVSDDGCTTILEDRLGVGGKRFIPKKVMDQYNSNYFPLQPIAAIIYHTEEGKNGYAVITLADEKDLKLVNMRSDVDPSDFPD